MQRTHDIFAIQLVGKKFYIITGPEDVAATYRDTEALAFDGQLNDLLLRFGFSADSLKRAWHKPEPYDWSYVADNPVNPHQMSFIHLTEESYKQQLLPGERMDWVCKAFLDAVDKSVCWDKLDYCSRGSHESGHGKQISLYAFCRHVLVDAALRSLCGPYLHELEPNIVDYMMHFNDNVWMIFFNYPFGSAMSRPRQKIIDALKRFIQLSEDLKPEQSWLLSTMLKAQGIIGIEMEARASLTLMVL